MDMNGIAYVSLMLASVCETAITVIILATLVFGSAGRRLPTRSRWLFKISQLGFTVLSIVILLEASRTWPAYFSMLLSILLWMSFIDRMAVFDFHIAKGLWRKDDADIVDKS